MHQILLIAVLCCCLSSQGLHAQGWQQLTSGLPSLWSVSAIDTSVCYVVGDRMEVAKSINGSSFTFLSDNSGLLPENYVANYARSASLVWVCNPKQIFKTTNGGSNWSKVFEFTGTGAQNVFFDGIYFWDDSVGVAISDQILANPNTMFIVRTTDGGSTWNQVSTGLPSGNGLFSYGGRLDAAGTHCWFPVNSGADADTTAPRFLLHSRNKGLTWESLPLPANNGQFAVSFSDTSEGVLADGNGHLATTADGGKTWQMRYYQSGVFPPTQFAKGTGTIWANGHFDQTYGYLVAKSTDYGATWTFQTKPMRAPATAMSVVNQNYVWISGFGNMILRTRTGGNPTSVFAGGKLPEIPSSFELMQNYPNPFNPSTMINYQLATNSHVTLKVYDLLGREVKTLVNERQTAGAHSVTFNASTLASGVYFYRMEAGNFAKTKKLVLMK